VSTNRKCVFINDRYYHVFNRGFEKREVFSQTREYLRALKTATYYQYRGKPLSFSHFLRQSESDQAKMLSSIQKTDNKLVDIVAYCLMPNHFHFILKQNQKNGISKFISDFTNSYTKYFNTRHERGLMLFQGTFRAVPVEDDEQLLHLSRYIHLNPFVSSIVELADLEKYPWSSYSEYLEQNNNALSDSDLIIKMIGGTKNYREFVDNQAEYAKELEEIKHLSLES
jgi:putative transposase